MMMGGVAIEFLFFGVFQLIYAIPAWFLAPRLGAKRWLWVVLALIPLFGMFFGIYMFFRIAAVVLDRLDDIQNRLPQRL
jgi:hypothetical protein